MFPYLGLFAYFAAGSLINAFRAVRSRPRFLWVTATLLVIVIGLRWEVGADWVTYQALLDLSYMGAPNSNLHTEPAYELLNWIAAQQNWGIWFPNLICAIIFVYGLLVFCGRQPNPWLALVVAAPYLIIGVGMGYTRQSAAMGLAMIALTQFTRGAHVRMFITLGLATMFHTSAIVLAPLFAVAIVKRGIISGFILVIFAVLLYYAFSQRIDMRMSEYQTYKYVAAGAIPRILMNVFAALVFLLGRRRFSTNPEEIRLWTFFSLATFMMVPLLSFVSSNTIVDRIGIFLVPLQLFVFSRVPSIFGEENRENTGLLVLIILYSFAAEFVWLSFGNEAQSWIPYRNLLWERLFGA